MHCTCANKLKVNKCNANGHWYKTCQHNELHFALLETQYCMCVQVAAKLASDESQAASLDELSRQVLAARAAAKSQSEKSRCEKFCQMWSLSHFSMYISLHGTPAIDGQDCAVRMHVAGQ